MQRFLCIPICPIIWRVFADSSYLYRRSIFSRSKIFCVRFCKIKIKSKDQKRLERYRKIKIIFLSFSTFLFLLTSCLTAIHALPWSRSPISPSFSKAPSRSLVLLAFGPIIVCIVCIHDKKIYLKKKVNNKLE